MFFGRLSQPASEAIITVRHNIIHILFFMVIPISVEFIIKKKRKVPVIYRIPFPFTTIILSYEYIFFNNQRLY